MCPFTFEDIGFVDPAVYADYLEFIDGNEITWGVALIVREYLETTEYASVTLAIQEIFEEKWIRG
ncbi:MAG: hypothetical protein VZQ98_14425 [Bacteroidales bacterium]|nr:hypothetical protein [Bacteroidales bacterium]